MNIKEIYDDEELMEVARYAVESELIKWREARLSELMRRNGLVIAEKDGTPSQVIRFGMETAMVIGLKAIEKHLAERKDSSDE